LRKLNHYSLDGLLSAIGHSQIVRPALALANQGFKVQLVSLEQSDETHELAVQLSRAGIGWFYDRFEAGGSPKVYARNVARLTRLALRADKPDVAWIRGFPAAPVGLMWSLRGVPFVYDIRGFWVDQRAASDAWPPVAIAAARALEATYYRSAAAAVSLTQLGADDITSGRFGKWHPDKPAAVIPTCVDYDAFTLRTQTKALRIGFVGSVNSDYLIEESLALVCHVQALRPDATLVCVSAQHAQLQTLALKAGVKNLEAFSARHDEMPKVMRTLDWGLLLLKESEVKRASMPTKLAEFLAAGVRPVHYGCNSELGDWVTRTGSGFTLRSLGDLQSAAERIVATHFDAEGLANARALAEAHFSLRAGTAAYAKLFNSL
jgi:glycosyltransferase involved in cell wall biosynthesis